MYYLATQQEPNHNSLLSNQQTDDPSNGNSVSVSPRSKGSSTNLTDAASGHLAKGGLSLIKKEMQLNVLSRIYQLG